jgi:imidazolonepropionase-like amidohydrolase
MYSERVIEFERRKQVGKLYKVLKGGTVIDGTGRAPLKNAAVVIKGDRIDAVGPADSLYIPQDAEVISTTNKTVLPGLIDVHLHFLGMKNFDLPRWIMEPQELKCIRAVMDVWKVVDHGFTTILDSANANSHHLHRAIEEGSIVGPRFFFSGAMISHTGGSGDSVFTLPLETVKQGGCARIADGPDECRKAVREQLRKGATSIKISSAGGVAFDKFGPLSVPTAPQFTMEELKAMVEEAHNFGVKVFSHAFAGGIRTALLAGVDVIVHGCNLDDAIIEMIVKHDAYLIPTLHIVKALVTKCTGGLDEAMRTAMVKTLEDHFNGFRKVCKAGVRIGCGSDILSIPGVLPMGENAMELAVQVQEGRSPMEVIVSATKINSEILGVEKELGTLEVGKRADLIVVSGDPAADITILVNRSKIDRVYKDGKEVPRLDPSFTLARWQ